MDAFGSAVTKLATARLTKEAASKEKPSLARESVYRGLSGAVFGGVLAAEHSMGQRQAEEKILRTILGRGSGISSIEPRSGPSHLSQAGSKKLRDAIGRMRQARAAS